jgi:hypothetical protein
MARGAAINPTEGCDRANRATTGAAALPWGSLHQLFGAIRNMNSGNLISATAGSPSSELSRSWESGDHPPGHALVSQSVRGAGGAARAQTSTPPLPRSRSVRPAPGACMAGLAINKSSSGFSDLAPSILHYNWF